MIIMKKTLLGMAGTLVLAACTGADTSEPRPATLGLGLDTGHMDSTIRPQDDFFSYVNGGWLAETEIPADRVRWGSFDALADHAEEQVLALITEAAADSGAAPGSNSRKIGDLFHAYMDVETIEARGLAPLADQLAAIDALATHAELAAYWGDSRRNGSTAPLGFAVGQDQGQADRYITTLGQGGLGLPDREYYLADDERSRELLAAYQAHVARLFELAGVAAFEQAAERVVAVETLIAQAHWTRVQNRDRTATYNRMTLAEVAAIAPNLDMPVMLAAGDIDGIDEIVIRQPSYLARIARTYTEVSLADWQHYHRFHLLRSSAPYLPAAFVEANFEFYGRTLNGQLEMRPREKRGVALVQAVLGFMVGEQYVARHFQPEAKERMDAMVENLKRAFEQAIDELEWMTEETKLEAQAKLARFNTKIGYPDVWLDYDCVHIDATDLIGNLRRSNACEHARNVARLGQPVDRDEWFMTPQTVNAYYSPTMNEIVFPAAILQPPFFNVEADDAINYGAIGGVIGHEITHGFDDQGRHSDGEGNLRDWWTPADAEQFRARTQLLIDQYSAYEPIEGMNINGAVALGENIADLGGLTVAYRAYRLSLGDEPAPVIAGFDGSQRFFLGWGQVWRISFRDEALRRQLMTGPHSPGRYRVLGVLSNMPEFYEAFGVEPGDGMYRPDEVRVKIW
jgi:putative endopeptidase